MSFTHMLQEFRIGELDEGKRIFSVDGLVYLQLLCLLEKDKLTNWKQSKSNTDATLECHRLLGLHPCSVWLILIMSKICWSLQEVRCPEDHVDEGDQGNALRTAPSLAKWSPNPDHSYSPTFLNYVVMEKIPLCIIMDYLNHVIDRMFNSRSLVTSKLYPPWWFGGMEGVFMSRGVSPDILKGPPNYHNEGHCRWWPLDFVCLAFFTFHKLDADQRSIMFDSDWSW